MIAQLSFVVRCWFVLVGWFGVGVGVRLLCQIDCLSVVCLFVGWLVGWLVVGWFGVCVRVGVFWCWFWFGFCLFVCWWCVHVVCFFAVCHAGSEFPTAAAVSYPILASGNLNPRPKWDAHVGMFVHWGQPFPWLAFFVLFALGTPLDWNVHQARMNFMTPDVFLVTVMYPMYTFKIYEVVCKRNE